MTRQKGFSLIELMITVGIVAILTTVAVASYSTYITRSKRAAAKTALLQDAQYMERWYTVSGCYTNTDPGCAGNAVVLPIAAAPLDSTPSYTVQFVQPPTASTYTLIATPSNGFSDPTCGSFTLDNTGAKSLSPATDATTVQSCWSR